MKSLWYAAVRKSSQPDSWRCLLGPYKTKREADGMRPTAMLLFDRHHADAATLELRGLTWGALLMKPGYVSPGLMNDLLGGVR